MANVEGYKLVKKHFSSYVLPGRIDDPLRCIDEAKAATSIGLGGVWVSERFALKEPAVIAGLLASAAPDLRIGATFYAHLRHPIVTASIANLMQAITRDKFTLVLARASPAFFTGYGVPPLNFERLADSIDIYRRLWRGESVTYQGILGQFDRLKLSNYYEGPPPPIVFTAMGPKALAFAGKYCDGVLLHPLLTPDAVTRSAEAVRRAAESAGRHPSDIKIIANVMVAPELTKDEEEAVIGGRAVTYLQSTTIGPLLAELNQWDTTVLDRLRAHPTIAVHKNEIVSESKTRQELVEASRVIPQEWLENSTVSGTATSCANQLCRYLNGADEILLHASSPASMGRLTSALADELTQ